MRTFSSIAMSILFVSVAIAQERGAPIFSDSFNTVATFAENWVPQGGEHQARKRGGQLRAGRHADDAAYVKLLSDGKTRLETMKTGLDAGPTAVLTFDTFTVVVFSKTLSLFDRAGYYANGIDPKDFDVIVVKSPHTEYHMYDEWIEKNFNIDVPGATSANLPTLGHTICARPMFPLDEETEFDPRPKTYSRQL